MLILYASKRARISVTFFCRMQGRTSPEVPQSRIFETLYQFRVDSFWGVSWEAEDNS